MFASLSKKMSKSWPIIVAFFLSISGGILLIPASGTSAEVSEFKKLFQEYNALVAQLDANLAEYRASIPLFAKFSDVVTNKIVPVVIEGEKAATWLSDTHERGLHSYYENSKYEKKIAEKSIADILAARYKEVCSEFQSAIDANQLTLPNKQEEIYFRACHHQFQNVAEPLLGPLQDHIPYEKGTVEYYLFFKDLGQTAVMASSPLGKMIYQAPPPIQQKQRSADQLYDKLVQWKKQSKIDIQLPPKYKEEYLARLERESQKIGKISELRRELRKIENGGLNIIQLGVIDKAVK